MLRSECEGCVAMLMCLANGCGQEQGIRRMHIERAASRVQIVRPPRH